MAYGRKNIPDRENSLANPHSRLTGRLLMGPSQEKRSRNFWSGFVGPGLVRSDKVSQQFWTLS